MSSERERYGYHHHRVILQGDMLVIGLGEVVIEEPIRASRALLVHSSEAIDVAFIDEQQIPVCGPMVPDELDWEIIRRHHGSDELFLKITWRVQCARTIVWRVHDVD